MSGKEGVYSDLVTDKQGGRVQFPISAQTKNHNRWTSDLSPRELGHRTSPDEPMYVARNPEVVLLPQRFYSNDNDYDTVQTPRLDSRTQKGGNAPRKWFGGVPQSAPNTKKNSVTRNAGIKSSPNTVSFSDNRLPVVNNIWVPINRPTASSNSNPQTPTRFFHAPSSPPTSAYSGSQGRGRIYPKVSNTDAAASRDEEKTTRAFLGKFRKEQSSERPAVPVRKTSLKNKDVVNVKAAHRPL